MSHSLGEGLGMLLGLAQQVEHKAQGCLAPYAGKFAEFGDRFL